MAILWMRAPSEWPGMEKGEGDVFTYLRTGNPCTGAWEKGMGLTGG